MAEPSDLKNMVMSFRVSELQVLLGFAGRNRSGRKSELLTRALQLLEKPTATPVQVKIRELYRKNRKDVPKSSKNKAHPNSAPTAPPSQPPAGPIDYKDYKDYNRVPPIPTSPHSQIPVHPDVRLKRLPFYDILGELLKPSSLAPRNASRFQETFFVFHLTPQQANDIANSRDLRPGARCDYTVQVQLRFCLSETSCDQEDNFPPSICVRVNGKMAPLPNPIPTNKPGVEPKRPSRPVNITTICRISPTVPNHINISWAADMGRGYCVAVYLVRRLNSDILLSRLKQKGSRHPDHTRALIKEKLSHDPDSEIATTSLRVSLMCPLGKMRMSVPCRPFTCNHLQCFDAPMFLQMNEKKPTWNCPVCDRPAEFDSLFIDGLFTELLASASEAPEIEFNPEGEWKPMKEKESRSTASKAPADVEMIADGCDSDQDSNNPVILKAEASKSSGNGESAPSGGGGGIIDLTETDDEEAPHAISSSSSESSSSSSSPPSVIATVPASTATKSAHHSGGVQAPLSPDCVIPDLLSGVPPLPDLSPPTSPLPGGSSPENSPPRLRREASTVAAARIELQDNSGDESLILLRSSSASRSRSRSPKKHRSKKPKSSKRKRKSRSKERRKHRLSKSSSSSGNEQQRGSPKRRDSDSSDSDEWLPPSKKSKTDQSSSKSRSRSVTPKPKRSRTKSKNYISSSSSSSSSPPPIWRKKSKSPSRKKRRHKHSTSQSRSSQSATDSSKSNSRNASSENQTDTSKSQNTSINTSQSKDESSNWGKAKSTNPRPRSHSSASSGSPLVIDETVIDTGSEIDIVFETTGEEKIQSQLNQLIELSKEAVANVMATSSADHLTPGRLPSPPMDFPAILPPPMQLSTCSLPPLPSSLLPPLPPVPAPASFSHASVTSTPPVTAWSSAHTNTMAAVAAAAAAAAVSSCSSLPPPPAWSPTASSQDSGGPQPPAAGITSRSSSQESLSTAQDLPPISNPSLDYHSLPHEFSSGPALFPGMLDMPDLGDFP